MRSENPAFFLFGGTFLNDLRPHLQAMGTVSGRMIGISPLSQVSMDPEKKALSCWLPELDARLAQAGAEYLVLDLQQARQNLLSVGGCYVSASAQALNALKRDEIAVMDPMTLLWDELEDAIDGFSRVIAKHFSGDQIVLIQTAYPAYHLEGNNLRPQSTFPVSAKHVTWMENLEKRFREQTGCHMVDVTRFYFYRKEEGFPLTDVIFEKECYEDVAYRIRQILDGGDGTAERPRFDLSLHRYENYFFTLQKKPQRIFLDAGRVLDKLVLSASDIFVRTHREGLLALDALDWTVPEKALAAMETLDPGSILTRVFRAFWETDNGRFNTAGVDYSTMFRAGVVPDSLIKHLKEHYAAVADLLPAQINRYNAGFHFAKMKGLDPKPFTTDLTVARPTVIDIFGSCISRTPFTVQENDFAVNKYWFHVSPFEYRNQPYNYDPSLFPEKPVWTDRLVKQQFECTIYRDVRQSKGEWLVIDLYALVSGYIYRIGDCLYGDFDRRISNLLKAERVDLYRDASILGDHDALIEALNPWLDLIKKKYGDKIILIDGQRMAHWIGDDSKLYRDKKPSECNPFWTRAAEVVSRKLNCYRISMGRYFLPDELSLMRNTPAHKENLGYQAMHDIVRYIVDRQPKEKRFDRYSGHIQVLHLERLVERNGAAVLEEALPLNALDKAVIRLGHEEMVKRHDALAALYDTCDWTESLEEILRVAEPELAKRLREAAKVPTDVLGKLATGYPGYPAKREVFSGRNPGCALPKFPAVKGFKLALDKDGVKVTWSGPKEETLQICRRSEQTPWQVIGESASGSFVDKSAQVGTEYFYRLCVKVKQESRYFCGGFTGAKSIKIAVGTPVLVSAVLMNGVNTLRWAPVKGADAYRVYRKNAADKWEVCVTVEAGGDTVFSEPSQTPDGGTCYTVRALKNEDGTQSLGGYGPGINALPL